MKADAIITMYTEWHEDPLNPGSGYCTETPIKWEGGPIARLDRWQLRDLGHDGYPPIGARLSFGPWVLIVVAHSDFAFPCVYVTRDPRWAWWYALRFRAARFWQPFKCRVIATCAVWGLAKYEWNASASWSQLYAVAWLKARLKWSS